MLIQPSSNRGRLLAWVAVIVLTTWLVFIGGGAAATLDPRLRMSSQVLIGAVIAVWTLVALRRPEWRPRSVLPPGLAVALAAFALSTALAPRPRLGIEYLAYAFLLVVLYLLLVRLLAVPWFRARILTLAGTLAVVIGILYVAIVIGSWIEWWGLVGRITAPPRRPSFAGMTWANPSAVLAMSTLLTIPAVASRPPRHGGTSSRCRSSGRRPRTPGDTRSRKPCSRGSTCWGRTTSRSR